MLELGTEESPLVVTCDVTEGKYRHLYVKVPDSCQLAQIEALDSVELDRLSPVEHTARGSNVHWGGMQIARSDNMLTGRKVIGKARPGAATALICTRRRLGSSDEFLLVHIGKRTETIR